MNRTPTARASHIPGVENGYERQYSAHLEQLKRDGAILFYKFEAVRLKLAANTTYTPDFLVIRNDFAVEFHEVKGVWRDDARVKIKTASALYPFIFRAYTQPTPGTWAEETFTKTEPVLTDDEARALNVSRELSNLSDRQILDIARIVLHYYFGGNTLSKFILDLAGIHLAENPLA